MNDQSNLPPSLTLKALDHQLGDEPEEFVEEDEHDEEIFNSDNDTEL